jgi:ArsR family transcriptional regulator
MNMIKAETNIEFPDIKGQARLFKLLSHPLRLAILDQLRDGEHCVCHLEAHLGVKQAAISQQLALMRTNGLLADRRDGWNVYYRVADPRVFKILELTRTLTGSTPLPRFPEGVVCPCPHCKSKVTKEEI